MSESKHTPGPWLIGYGGMEGDGYATITSPHKETAICDLTERSGDDEEMRANAALIARAPDLLAEVETLRAQRDACRDAADFLLPYFEAEIEAEREHAANGTPEAEARADWLAALAVGFRAAIDAAKVA